MSLTLIAGLVVFSIAYWTIIPPNYRQAALLVGSVIALYGLQPAVGVEGLNFVLPTLTIIMVIGVGLLVRSPDVNAKNISWQWLLLILACLCLMVFLAPQASSIAAATKDFLRFGTQNSLPSLVMGSALIGFSVIALSPLSKRHFLIIAAVLILLLLVQQGTRVAFLIHIIIDGLPPYRQLLLLAVVTCLGFLPLINHRQISHPTRKNIALLWLGLMFVIFVVLKVQPLNQTLVSQLSNQVSNQGGMTASVPFIDLQWLGISYIIFRLAHVLLDFRNNTLRVQFGLIDFIIYVLFFPTLIAGPITRADKVIPQLSTNIQAFKVDYLAVGGIRLMAGLFKKFVVASLLEVIMLRPLLFTNSNYLPVMWLMLYVYFFHLYFDFSGYSDIAIGLGQCLGIGLPENFDRPFFQPNMSLFWQSWHITLSTWMRQYWFNPLTRRLMKSKLKEHPNLILFIGQMSTMALTGLWHSAALNWFVWGLWNGIGLFLNKVYGNFSRRHFQKVTQNPRYAKLFYGLNVFFTFHFVLLSMAFIAFPDLKDGVRFLLAIFGKRI